MDPGIIKAGLSLVGGLFGGKKKGPDLVKMRDDALEAGFNPGTVLKATGGQGWMGGELTGGAFMANALKDGFDTWFNYQDEQQDREIADLQKQILQAELNEIQGAGDYTRGHGFDVPEIVTHADETTNEPPEMGVTPYIGGGLTFGQSADADTVWEIESDAYKNAVKGKFFPWMGELAKRNVPWGLPEWSDLITGTPEAGFMGRKKIQRHFDHKFSPETAPKNLFEAFGWGDWGN